MKRISETAVFIWLRSFTERLSRKKGEDNKIPCELSMGIHLTEDRESPVYTLEKILMAGAGIIGCLLCFLTAMESRGLDCFDRSQALAAAVIGWLWFSLLYGLGERLPGFSGKASGVSIIGLLLFGIGNVRKIASGFMAAANALLGSLFEKYREAPLFDPSLAVADIPGAVPESFIGLSLCFFTLLIAAAACRCSVKKPLFIPFFIATFLLPEIALYFGIVPHYAAFGLLICSWCAVLAAEIAGLGILGLEDARGLLSKTASQSGVAALLSMAVAFTAAAVIARDHSRPESVDSFRTAVVVYMRSFTWQKFTEDLRDAFLPSDDPGVTHDGKLGNVDSVEFGGNIMLYVTLPENADTLYLKGFTGTDYQGSRWASGPPLPALETKLTSQEFFPARIMKSTPPFEGLSSENVIVRNIGMSDSVRYFPVGAAGLLETDGKRRRYGVYFPESGWQQQVIETAPKIILSGDTARDEAAMRSYAYSFCLDVPETFTAAEDFFDQYHGVSLYYELEYIRQGLARQCSYDLTAGKKPFGVDFAQWFMTENRKGSCTHFATAAALLCRSRGIPARYCEGFIIKAEDIKDAPVKDGYAAVSVPDSRAHAWVEVYVDNVGWIPFEATPGYGNIAFSGYSSDGSETSVITRVETEPTAPMTEQITITSEINPENASEDMTEVTVTAPAQTSVTEPQVSVDTGAETSLPESSVSGTEESFNAESIPGENLPGETAQGTEAPGETDNMGGNMPGNGSYEGGSPDGDIPEGDISGEDMPGEMSPEGGVDVTGEITGENGSPMDGNVTGENLPPPGNPGLYEETEQSGGVPDSDRDDQRLNKNNARIVAVIRIILVILAPFAVIFLIAGVFVLRRSIIISRRRQLIENDRKKAAEQIYLLLRRAAMSKKITLDNIPTDRRGAYLKEKGEPWGGEAEIIISAAMSARFGRGISPGELERAAKAYEVIAGRLMEKPSDRLVYKYLKCADVYCSAESRVKPEQTNRENENEKTDRNI